MLKRSLMAATLVAAAAAPHAMAAQGTFDTRSMTTETALKAAQAALESCRQGGFQVTVSVVDRGGNVQVMLRDRFAGPHTPDTATRKAWTAVSFRNDTVSLAAQMKAGELPEGLNQITGALMLGGGRPIQSAGSIVGGIGISGAPSPVTDDACAQAGIDAIVEELAF